MYIDDRVTIFVLLFCKIKDQRDRQINDQQRKCQMDRKPHRILRHWIREGFIFSFSF